MRLSDRSAFPIWWASRTARERALLGFLAALIVAIGFWYGLVVPLRAAEAAARDRHARAVERLLAVSASAQEVAALQSARATGPAGQALTGTVVQTALTNGVSLTQQTPDTTGGVAVSIDAADPASAFRWIAVLQRDHGIGVAALALTRNPDRTLRLQIRFTGGAT